MTVRCATNRAAGRWGGGLAFWRNRQARYGKYDGTHDLAPLPLAGLLFGDPCPLRWLPADALRMPRADSAEAAGALFLRAGSDGGAKSALG